jgi:hypothetical protein
VLSKQGDFAEPGWRRGHGSGKGLDAHRSISDTVHVDLLDENGFVLPHQGDIFLSWFAICYNLVAQLVGRTLHMYHVGENYHAMLKTNTDKSNAAAQM